MTWPVDDFEDDNGPPSIDELQAGIELLETMLGVLATAVPGGMGNQRAYRRLHRQLNRLLDRAEITTPFRWDTLDEWGQFFRTKYPENYNARQGHVNKVIEEVRSSLQNRLDELEAGDLRGDVDDLGEFTDDVLADPSGIRVELNQLPGLLRTDLSAAVSTAKNLVEATAKVVLAAHGKEASTHSFDKLVNAALRTLELDPDPKGQSPEAAAMYLVKQLTAYVSTVRNDFGNGHGNGQVLVGLEPRHARLAVRASLAWCHFVLETLQQRDIPRAAAPDAGREAATQNGAS